MKITITGPAGFIGKNLVPKLKGHEVLLDNTDVITGTLEPTDLIIHLAALNKTGESIEQPYRYFENNVLGTVRMLEEARRLNAKFMYLATIKQNENNTYGVSKLTATKWIECYRDTYGIDTIINMVGNVYGPYGDHLFVNQFIQKTLKKEPVVVFGVGKEMRSILYIDDLTDFITHQINHFDWYKNEVTPINGGEENIVSIREIVDYLEPEIVNYKPAIKGQKKININTDTAIKNPTHWKEGIEKTIKHYG